MDFLTVTTVDIGDGRMRFSPRPKSDINFTYYQYAYSHIIADLYSHAISNCNSDFYVYTYGDANITCLE